jgi:hypothetical protein
MWLTYSMNKEDIWISRVPTPIRYAVKGDVYNDFEQMETGKPIIGWNTYSPQWAPVEVVKTKDQNKCLRLKDKDPYDYARAIRIMEEGNKIEIAFKINVELPGRVPFEIDVTDRFGNRPVRISFNNKGQITASDGCEKKVIATYKANDWVALKLQVEVSPFSRYSLWVNGGQLVSNFSLTAAVKSVERVSFRTGTYRDIPNRNTPNETPGPPLVGADDPVEEATYLIDDFSAKPFR